jgi:hypothetical protein
MVKLGNIEKIHCHLSAGQLSWIYYQNQNYLDMASQKYEPSSCPLL